MRKLSRDDFNEMYEIREVLEGMAARLASTRIPECEIDRLSEQMDSCKRDLARGQVNSFLEFDETLHTLILDHCGNKRLCETLNSIKDLVSYFRTEVAMDMSRADDAVEEHGRIIAALRLRDPAKAEEAARDHIRITHERTLRDIDFTSLERG